MMNANYLQDLNVWPLAILSLCNWHAKHALQEYFKEHNQSPFITQHPPLDYKDDDRTRKWDIDTFLTDTSWIARLNQQTEDAFCDRVKAKYPNLIGQELDKCIRELGSKKQHCISEKENRTAIIDLFMLHLEWHSIIFMGPMKEDVETAFDSQNAWELQTIEMHNLCKQLGEAWAWEYLFKNWYRPSRWLIWARAIAEKVPIIQSNGIVESLWSVLKKGYLRKHSRPKMEFLIHIIMDQYIPARAELIGEHRRFKRIETAQNPAW